MTNSMHITSIHDFMPLPDNHLQYKEEFIRRMGVIVLGHHQNEAGAPKTALIGLSNASSELREYLKIYHREFEDLSVAFVNIDMEELQLYASTKSLDKTDFSSFEENTDGQNQKLFPAGAAPPSPDYQSNPISNLLNNILLESIRMSAQDLHFEPGESGGLVRICMSGRSRILRRIEPPLFIPLINQIKILSGINLLETHKPQDASFRFGAGNRNIDVRVSAIRTLHGESISLRILLPLASSKSLEELGYRNETLEFLKEVIHEEQGLLLFCGPTGSGKSTSMNSLLRKHDPERKKIISIEDPVEIHNPQIEQIQVQEEWGMGFAQILKRVLRRNPDIILLGEIRDEETASLAVRAALGGHLVMSTLHCAKAADVFPRLEVLGVSRHYQNAVIRGIIAQRLVETSEGHIKVREELFIPEKFQHRAAREARETMEERGQQYECC